LLLAILVAAQVAKLIPRPRFAVVGVVLAITAFVLFRVTPAGTIDLSIALVFGIGVGLVVAVARRRRERAGQRRSADRRPMAVVLVGSVLAGGLVLWVGANDPTVQWFGHVITHGDRGDRRVALTFDDGPDDPFSLKVSAILDSHGAKGTFFEVGKAIDARPEIARALYADGHLLGNHSYHHDYWRWLDPRYPELNRTQDAFQRQLGICPAFFRPPHGQRTPFMLAHASDKNMHTVTWDVSAGDWSADDGAVVARKILEQVRPGSIILLHDGIDGTVTADRSVLIAALPIILDGLRAKGLQPVRLDELLGLPGYLDHC
jgi:peptidoglycan/xylan/chitin deacetylase (PgdA/CDA1 family)